jgi:hypothetical protein
MGLIYKIIHPTQVTIVVLGIDVISRIKIMATWDVMLSLGASIFRIDQDA